MNIKTIQKHGVSFQVIDNGSLSHGINFWDAVQFDRWENETFHIIHKYWSNRPTLF